MDINELLQNGGSSQPLSVTQQAHNPPKQETNWRTARPMAPPATMPMRALTSHGVLHVGRDKHKPLGTSDQTVPQRERPESVNKNMTMFVLETTGNM